MSLTRRELESARDAALGCARAAGQFLLDYCQPLDRGLPIQDPLALAKNALHDMRNLRSLLDAFAAAVTQPVLRFTLIANSPRNLEAWFDGHQFPTFHEVACAAAQMTYVTLALLAEDLPQDIPQPTALAASFRIELRDHQEHGGDFRSDRVVSCIERETAAAIRYLADSHRLADASPVHGMDESLSPALSPPVLARDPLREARDKWIYEEALKGTPWPRIRTVGEESSRLVEDEDAGRIV